MLRLCRHWQNLDYDGGGMELRRLDPAKKPTFVVPNHLVDQWGAEFLKLYPQARIFVAGKDHFETGKRHPAMRETR